MRLLTCHRKLIGLRQSPKLPSAPLRGGLFYLQEPEASSQASEYSDA
jgi:hypothetical protein